MSKMMKFSLLVVLACTVCSLAEPRVQQRGVIHQIQKGVAGPNPYIFLTVPKGRSQALVQGFEVIEENDKKKASVVEDKNEDDEMSEDDEDEMPQKLVNEEEDDDDDEEPQSPMDDEEDDMENDDEEEEEEELKNLLNNNYDEDDLADDDEDDMENDELDNVMSKNLRLRRAGAQIRNAKPTQMMVSREHAGAIMVPDEIIEIEGQSVVDENTGKPALLLPRSVLDSIPDGSVVALMERSLDDKSEERANRVIVRRRRKGARRNIKRRRGGNRRRRVNKRGGNKRRRNYRRKNVRVIRRGNKNGRRGNKRRRVNRRRVSYRG